jgi:threonyl-tRNA synthetase
MALKDAPIVNMLSFDENEAYNHDRPISSLVRTQLLHLHTAENLWLPPEDRTNININDLHTEKKASEYIQKVTALLHRHGKRQEKQVSSRAKSKKTKAAKAAKSPKKVASVGRKKSSKTRSAAKKRSSRR